MKQRTDGIKISRKVTGLNLVIARNILVDIIRLDKK
jgi:hypothetical protein